MDNVQITSTMVVEDTEEVNDGVPARSVDDAPLLKDDAEDEGKFHGSYRETNDRPCLTVIADEKSLARAASTEGAGAQSDELMEDVEQMGDGGSAESSRECSVEVRPTSTG